MADADSVDTDAMSIFVVNAVDADDIVAAHVGDVGDAVDAMCDVNDAVSTDIDEMSADAESVNTDYTSNVDDVADAVVVTLADAANVTDAVTLLL